MIQAPQTPPPRSVSIGPILTAAGLVDVLLGAGFYHFNPLALEAWINAVVAASLVAAGVSVIGFGQWRQRRERTLREADRRRLID